MQAAWFTDDLRRSVPYPVGIGIRRSSDGAPPALLPLEEETLGPDAAERRRLHFALGRAAARDALADLGVPAVAIGRAPSGEPAWPAGIVGAISHSGNLAVAVVGRRLDYAGLGVDVEQLYPGLSSKAARRVCTPDEYTWVDTGDALRRTLLFSAKEAVFKALFPIERVWLGFGDVELRWRPEREAFEARLLKRASAAHPLGARLEVACTISGSEVVCTTYALPSG